MSKTVELRKIIVNQLKKVTNNIYHINVHDSAIFPYVTYNLDSTVSNYYRYDTSLIIDVWDKSADSTIIENLADQVEEIFNFKNLPVGNNYPTFYFELRNVVEDDDELIQRRQLRFTIQNYNIKE